MEPYSSERLRLKRLGEDWEFRSEADLEDFLWLYLESLFNIVPLKRQFPIAGQVCDILALDADRRLLIIELKNEEDRYVVSQITRYYHAILQEKPLAEAIDYSQDIKLIVVAPSFHRDNFTDNKYSQLDIQFLNFKLAVENNRFTFNLRDTENISFASVTIAYQEYKNEKSIPEPPRKLISLLANTGDADRKAILQIREQILEFDERIQEFISGSSILYGSSKNKLCAELRYDTPRQSIALFLWLPNITSRRSTAKKITARMRIWTNWLEVSAIGHVPKGIGRMISLEELRSGSVRPLKKLLPRPNSFESPERYFSDPTYREKFADKQKFLTINPHYKNGMAMSSENYISLINKMGIDEIAPSALLQNFVNLTLKTWIERL